MVKYILFSDSSSNSTEAENIVKELYECQIIRKNVPAIIYGRAGRLNNFPVLEGTYPTLLVVKPSKVFREESIFPFAETTNIIGLESIRGYVRKVTVKLYLLKWLTLVNGTPPYLVFRVDEADFF